MVAVERHADAPRIDQLDPVVAEAAKLDVGVAEHHPPLARATEQPLVVVGRLQA